MKLDADKVRWHRDSRGWTLETTAEKAEVALGSVLRAEHGEDIRPSSGRRIARAFGVDISELVPDRPGATVPKGAAPNMSGQPKAEETGVQVAVGRTAEEAAEELERQRYAPTEIAQGWHRLAERWSERLEKGDVDARSLEVLVDTLEDVAIGMEANVAAERKELQARYGSEGARNRSELSPAINRLSALVGEILRKIDAGQLEAKPELRGQLIDLEERRLKRAS